MNSKKLIIKLNKIFNKEDKLDDNQRAAVTKVNSFITDKNSRLFMSRESDINYINNKDIIVTINPNKVVICKDSFTNIVELPERTINKLNYKFDSRIDREKQQYDELIKAKQLESINNIII